MTYETMDWEAEAKRIALAFEVQGECEFKFEDGYGYFRLMDGKMPHLENGGFLDISYSSYNNNEWSFHVYNRRNHYYFHIDFNRIAQLVDVVIQYKPSIGIIRALFHLDLLTPEVEAALQITISHHQKLEWTLEYEERLRQ